MKIQPITAEEKLLNYFLKTTRCLTCKNDYPRQMEDCPHCEHIYGEALEQEIYESNTQ